MKLKDTYSYFLLLFSFLISILNVESRLEDEPVISKKGSLSSGVIALIVIIIIFLIIGVAISLLYWASGFNIKIRKALLRFIPEKFLRTPHYGDDKSNYQKLEESYGRGHLFDDDFDDDDDSDDFLEEDANILDPDDL